MVMQTAVNAMNPSNMNFLENDIRFIRAMAGMSRSLDILCVIKFNFFKIESVESSDFKG